MNDKTPYPRWHRSIVPGLVSVVCLVVSCGEDAPIEPVPPPQPVATTVTVAPSSVTLNALRDTVRIISTVLDQNGQVMAGAPVAYSSSDQAVATVDGSGLVTAAGDGVATVTAMSGTASGTATVTVEQRVVEVRVMPDSVMFFAVGDTVRLVAEALDAKGQAVANAVFTWSSDEAIATVDGSGLVTAVGDGTATVTATSGTVSGTATVTVEQRAAEVRVSPDSATLFAVGDAVRLVAEALDANGQAMVNAVFAWSSDEAVATVDGSGLVTAAGDGTATVTATSGEASGTATVTVRSLSGAAKDRAILEALYHATGGPFWRDNDNWLTDAPLQDWYGVGTNHQGRVVELKLIDNNLEGRLLPELGSLDELRQLRIDTAFSVIWCHRPFNPPEPNTRDAGSSGWPGSAGEIGGQYSRSWVRHTVDGPTQVVDLLADVPARASLGGATGVQRAGNRLTGRIPPELGNLANLEILSLNQNELSGPIPPELGKLVNLENLWLRENQLTGSIPRELGNLTRLERLDLAVSYDLSLSPPGPRYFLSGPIPPELGKLVNLKELVLWGNKLTGSLPSEFAGLNELQSLSLTCNSLTGPVPPVLRQLHDLRHMNLSGNQFEGDIPAWLGELAHLEFVNLNSNHFLTGSIPSSIARLTDMVKLGLGSNRLSGPIPADLSRLANLEALAVGDNQLTGALPAQLGELTNLKTLTVFRNANLAGPIPRELMQTPLSGFAWGDTSLCSPRDRVFQAWLGSLPSHQGGDICTLPAPEVFAAFYEGTGGSGWTSNANWISDAPVSSWFGVTVEDSLVTALELPGNGLSGTLPSAVGDFPDLTRLDLARNALTSDLPADLGNLTDLETLDLSSNRFSGLVPHEFGGFGSLERLDLSGNELEGALPGVLANLQSLSDFNWSESGACAPEVAWFQTWLGSVATRSGPTCEGLFSVSVADAHLSQAAQSVGGAVPLIAGRPALMRVLATADRANDHRPGARAAFLLDGQEVHRSEMTLGSSRGLAEYLPGQLDQWHQAVIPADALRPGVELVVQIDPDSIIPRTDLDELRLPLDVREMPPMELTIVPVVTGSVWDEEVLDWIQRADDPPVEFMRAVLPVGELDLTIHEPLAVAAAPDPEDVQDWIDILQDIALLRATEGGSGYWYGVVNRDGSEGINGVAAVEGRVGLGIPEEEVFAHEVGHNMSLDHAPCGNPALLDPHYPYGDGSIGVHGFDPRSGELVDPSTPDLMSYCHPQWISDYSFNKALEYRIRAEAGARALAAQDGSRGSRLLLWGHVDPEGELDLDPAFTLDAPAKLPSGSGPYRVEGIARDGSSVFALDFDMEEVSEGSGSFLFLVPFAENRLASLERIVLSGPEGSTTLERDTPARPMAIAIDPATGRIRSILRGEAAGAAIAAAAADTPPGRAPREQLVVSHGLPGQVP